MKKYIRYLVYLWPLLVIAWATWVNRFPEGYIYGGGDFAQPLNIKETFSQFFYVWNNRLAAPAEGGFFSWFSAIPFYLIFYYLPSLAGLTDTQTLSYVFFGFFSLCYFSFLLAIRVFSSRRNSLLESIFSLIYAFNLTTLYFFTYSWGFSHIILLYAFLPLLTATFFKALESPASTYVYWFLVVLFLSIPSYTNSAFAVALALYLVLILFFASLLKAVIFGWAQVRVLAKIIVGGFFILSYWIWPTSVFVSEGLKGLSQGLFDLRGWLTAQSANLLSIFTGTPHYASYYPFKYENVYFSLLAFLPFIFFSWALFRNRQAGAERKKILTLAVVYLIFVFLVKKTMPPFGELSVWFFRLPLTATLRSYEKAAIFLPFTLLSATYLFAVSLRNRRLSFLGLLILLGILISPLPFYKGGIQTKYSIAFLANKSYKTAEYSILTKIPDDYHQLAKESNLNSSDTRIQAMPYNALNSILWVNYPKWKLIGSDPTESFFQKNTLFANSSTFVSQGWNMPEYFLRGSRNDSSYLKTLPLFNVSEIVYHKDVDVSYAIKAQPRIDNLESSKLLEKVKETESAVLYKLPEKMILPHFYVPEKTMSLDGSISGFANIASLKDLSQPSLVYWSNEETDKLPAFLQSGPSDRFIKPERVGSRLIKSAGSNSEESVIMPEVRFLPNSPFYFWVAWREKMLLDSTKNQLDQADLELWFSSKRLVELERLSAVETGEKLALSLGRYLDQLKKTVSFLEDLSNRRTDALEIVTKAKDYFREHKEIVDRLKFETRGIAEDQVLEINNLYIKAAGLITDEGNYNFILKVKKAGDYFLLLDSAEIDEDFSVSPTTPITFELDRQTKIKLSGVFVQGTWYSYGPVSLAAGYRSLSFPIIRSRNLVKNGSFEEDLSRTMTGTNLVNEGSQGNRSLKITADNYRQIEVEIPIEPLRVEARYKISFDYKTAMGNSLRFSIWQDRSDLASLREREEKGEKILVYTKNLSREALWNHFERDFAAGAQAKQAKLIFTLISRETSSVSLLDNVVVERVLEPNLIARKVQAESNSLTIGPKIKFVKLNPTHYRLFVTGADKPFSLIFSESFHSGWKAYAHSSDVSSKLEVTHSYLDGKVEELGKPRGFTFFETIKNWLVKPAPEANHFLANGYANGWYFDSTTIEGRPDFTLDIEFWPQRLFYLGLLTSVSLFLLLLGLLWRRLKARI